MAVLKLFVLTYQQLYSAACRKTTFLSSSIELQPRGHLSVANFERYTLAQIITFFIRIILVVSLIVIDVHARDVVERLINKQISSLNDFEWVSTMRYYLTKSVEDPNEPTVNIEMISTTIEYGFEYLGNTSRLVVTPLTERCYRTLMGALKMNLGGAPEVSDFNQ